MSPKSGLVRPHFGSFLFSVASFFYQHPSVFCITVSVAGVPSELYQSVYILNGSAVVAVRSEANKRELKGWRMLGAIFTQVRAQICAREAERREGAQQLFWHHPPALLRCCATNSFFPSHFEMFCNTYILGPASETVETLIEKSSSIAGRGWTLQ